MSEDNKYCYRGTDGDTEPIKCVYDALLGYPNYCRPVNSDKDERMFLNTHFKTENEAWESITKSVSAGVHLAEKRLKQLKDQLKNHMEFLDAEQKDFDSVMNNPLNPYSKQQP